MGAFTLITEVAVHAPPRASCTPRRSCFGKLPKTVFNDFVTSISTKPGPSNVNGADRAEALAQLAQFGDLADLVPDACP
jgi:hypothetical protein